MTSSESRTTQYQPAGPPGVTASRRRTSAPALTRRTVLLATGALGLSGALASQLRHAPVAVAESAGTVLPLVDPLPAGEPVRALFAPHEQIFGEFVPILAPLANSVVDDDPELYGWMEDGWWRTPNDPINSRIMEHVATLSWFLAHERPWNPYYLDPALEGRLDAAIGYYLSLQGPTGAWPVTYQAESLATTGFGLSALLETLRNLRAADLLPDRRSQIEDAAIPAATWLNDVSRPHWETPIAYANQVVGALAAVAEAADTLPAPDLASTLDDRMQRLAAHAQAPAGYFHEPLGLDQQYNVNVQLPDMALLYRYTGHPLILTMMERFTEFLGYSMIYEPDLAGAGSFYFASACARTASTARPDPRSERGDSAGLARDFLADVPAIGAFYVSREEKEAARQAWATDPAPVPPRAKGGTDPRNWMHVPLAPDNVGQVEREALVGELPYRRSDTFTQLRGGSINQDLLFVRRPGYYVGAVAGERGVLSDQPAKVRVGPGFFWHPEAGMVVHALNDTVDGHWTTRGEDGRDPALARRDATYHDGLTGDDPVIEPADLSGRGTVFTQRLTSTSTAVVTDTTFLPAGVTLIARSPVAATDHLPLTLRTGDVLTFSDGTVAGRGTTVAVRASHVMLTRGTTTILVSWGDVLPTELAPTGRTYLVGAFAEQHLLRISHAGALTTQITSLQADTHTDGVAGSVSVVREDHPGGPRVVAQVTNLEEVPIDVHLTVGGERRTVTALAPGARTDQLVDVGPRLPGAATVTARVAGPRPRTRVWRIRLDRPAS